MEIVALRPEHVEQLLALYLAQVERAPHCALVPTMTHFSNDLLGSLPEQARLYPIPTQVQLLVAEAAGGVCGFAALTCYKNDENEEQQAITGLFVANEAAGDALIQACEAQATDDKLYAFPNTHGNTLVQSYNAGWDGLSDRIPNVAQLLSRHRYRTYCRELHLTSQISATQRTPQLLPPAISLTYTANPADHHGVRLVRALDGETETGVCAYRTLTLLTDVPTASKTGYIEWLYVSGAYRRWGIARALMTTAMATLASEGCTECWLTTAADNWKAQALYYTLGFAVVDCSVSFQKRFNR
ncbi:MAG: N-acetyltransferase [Caldilineaceae bacterium]